MTGVLFSVAVAILRSHSKISGFRFSCKLTLKGYRYVRKLKRWSRAGISEASSPSSRADSTVLLFGRPRTQTFHSHLALGLAALEARPSRSKKILVSNDNRMDGGPGLEPFVTEVLTLLERWAVAHGVEIIVLSATERNRRYLKELRRAFLSSSEVLVFRAFGQSPLAELLIPNSVRRIEIMTQDVAPKFRPGEMDFFLTHPKRGTRLMAEQPDIFASHKMIIIPQMTQRASEIEIQHASGPSGLGAIPPNARGVIVMGSMRMGQYLESKDIICLSSDLEPPIHFVFVGSAGSVKIRLLLEKNGHSCQFLGYSSNLPLLFHDLREAAVPVVFFSPTEDEYSGSIKTIASTYLPYVGVEPCRIELERGETFSDRHLAVHRVREIMGMESPAHET